MPNSWASNDTFSINGVNGGILFDYNYWNNTCCTISKKLYLTWDLQFSSATSYIYSGYWRYRAGAFYEFYNATNQMWINFNEWSRLVQIDNAAISITNSTYSASFWGTYGYLWSSGSGTNTGTGTQIWSLLCSHRIKCTEIDAFSSKNIKNIYNEEQNINYGEIKSEFLNIKFSEYSFKKENNKSQIGMIAEELNDNEYFKRFVTWNVQCDYENILYRCQCKLNHDNIYDVITTENINLDDIKIKIYIECCQKVVYTKINNMQISITDYNNNDIFDIVILSWEINIPTINKTAMFETWMYILKQHLIEYANDKAKFLEKKETTKKAKKIVDESLWELRYQELKNEIADFQQWFAIMNKRTLIKSESQQKLNVVYDELIKKYDEVTKHNEMLLNMNKELTKKYNELVEDNKNMKSDISKIYDLIDPKKKIIKNKILSPIKK